MECGAICVSNSKGNLVETNRTLTRVVANVRDLSDRRAGRAEPVCAATGVLALRGRAFLAVEARRAVSATGRRRQALRDAIPANGTLAFDA